MTQTHPAIKFIRVDLDNNAWATQTIRAVPTCVAFRDGDMVGSITVPQGALPFIHEVTTKLGV